MDKYKFDVLHSKKIVQAIVEGYLEYIEHRMDRDREMIISSAFAWTKGNFIENKLAEIGKEINLTCKKAKAGLAWEYLQFVQEDKKVLFIIRNGAYFNPNRFSYATLPTQTSNVKRRTYLHELSKINRNIEFPSQPQPQVDTFKNVMQLSLNFNIPKEQVKDELDKLKLEFDEFHIFTYKIDRAFQIYEIKQYLPNPEDTIAYEIEDLSKHISGAELTDEQREVIAPVLSDDLIDPAAFDIGIDEEEESN